MFLIQFVWESLGDQTSHLYISPPQSNGCGPRVHLNGIIRSGISYQLGLSRLV